MSKFGIEPGTLHGNRRNVEDPNAADDAIIAEVARMTADEFKKKYIKGPEAAANMAAYLAAKERKNG